jgi:hypothetical protein
MTIVAAVNRIVNPGSRNTAALRPGFFGWVVDSRRRGG